ncbi:MAG: Ig-like domain-containing protein, partial [Clostridia bacterium]|nr:Ig-like domain-containing protein [Clostridia bacterium]
MKKALSILLSVAMLLSLLPMSAMALPATYEPLSYNEGTLIMLDIGTSTWCRFVPTVSQTYQIYSYNSDGLDPVAKLYDSVRAELAHDDDYDGRDFRISYAMTAGETYYLEVYDYGKDDAGSLMIMVEDNLPTELYFEEDHIETFAGTQYAMEATVFPDDADKRLTWSSSDESIATVDENGVITFLKDGEVTITAETINGITETCNIVVMQVDGSLVLNEAKTIRVTTESSPRTCLMFTPAETGYYRIKSFDIVSDFDDPEIDPRVSIYDAEHTRVGYGDDTDVDRNFSADAALEAGQPYFCYIDLYEEEALGSYSVVVQQIEAASSISIDCADIVVKQGEFIELSVSFAPEGCWQEAYTISSSDESVIEVEGMRLYAVGSGEAVVTVISYESGLTDSITITVIGVTELKLDTTYTAQLVADDGANYVRYVFKPTVSGLYTITSDEAVGEDVSTSVVLHEKTTELRYNYIDGASFRLTHELMAGELYFYDVYLENPNVNRSIRFMLTKEDETTMPQAFVNTDYRIEIDNAGDGVFYMFKPTMSGEYTIFSTSDSEDTDPKLYVYDDEWNHVVTNDDGAGDRNYSLTYAFEAGETYYLKNILYHSDEIGSYTMRIEPEFELLEAATVSGTVSGFKADTSVVIWLIADGSTEPAYEVILEGNGDYEIENVPLGTYTVQMNATGYVTLTMTVIIEGTTIVNFEAETAKPVYIVWLYLSETSTEPTYGLDIE